jgi:hypothetical protein
VYLQEGGVVSLFAYVDNIGNLLSSVLRWLEQPDEDEKWWQLQTQVTQLCVLELELKGSSNSKLSGATASVREMADAMVRRERMAALLCGKRALDELNDPN